MTDIDAQAFDEFEAAGWELVAGRYGELLSPITSQAIEPLLDAAGVRAGMRVLDVGTGPGDAAATAVARGADVTGIDIAAAMVEIASRRHPDAVFVQGSATELPFADESFDAAVGNIVILHVGEPERAALELARVLVPGGRLALSTWDVPERSPLFGALVGAVADADVSPPGDVPHGPSFFQFGDDDVFRALLLGAGFADVEIRSFTFDFPLRSADELMTVVAEATVRMGALLRAGDDSQRTRMRESLERRIEPWRRGDGYAVPAPMKIAAGTKPG
jgi:SAM-dependent methyltransferase